MTEQIHVEKEGFAERESVHHPELTGIALRRVERIAIIGAGTMGTGIAIAALDAGFRVLLLEREKEALDQGECRLRDHYATRVSKGKVSAELVQEHLACLQGSIDWQLLAGMDLVIEAVFEDLEVNCQ